MVAKKIKRKIDKIRRKIGVIKLPVLERHIINEKSTIYTHVAAFLLSNAGDVLLPITLQDLFQYKRKGLNWKNIHAHWVISDELITDINNTDGLIIGGGGLFLKDTNPNQLSGWQWSCSIESLKKISVPMAIFAAGYNRFQGQEDFDPIFKEHIKLLSEKAVYIGLRNHGSITAIRNYLPENLHNKIRFQPCMTTLISRIYPNFYDYENKEEFIVLNCAFDRNNLRFGEKEDQILTYIALACKELSKDYKFKYYAHSEKDLKMIPILERVGLKFELVNFKFMHPKKIIEAYSKPSLVIGMRGHAQMIPFGCLTPILSLISHDKMQWFLDDINQVDWGVDIKNPDLKDLIVHKSKNILNNRLETIDIIKEEQDKLLKISMKNVNDFEESRKVYLKNNTLIA